MNLFVFICFVREGGVTNNVSQLLFLYQVKLKETVEAAAKFDPHVVLTVDSKGFSFRFLKKLRGTDSLPCSKN